MSRRARVGLFLLGALGVAVLVTLAAFRMPGFGTTEHPYGKHAVAAAVQHSTANTVMSVTFDERGTDTFGEEIILFASVLGATVLLRRRPDETKDSSVSGGRSAELPDDQAVLATGWLTLPVTVLVGWYLVAHGHVSPGGGFQGGVTLASALHLVYLAGNYPALERVRPDGMYDAADAAGALGYAILGLAVMITGAAFLTNVLPKGELTSFLSAGTVPVLNFAVGVEVGSAFVLLIVEFLEQTLAVRRQTREESES